MTAVPPAGKPERGRTTTLGWPRRLSLRARLLAVAVGLLVVALVLAGAATLTVLRGVLADQIDRQLTTAASDAAANPREFDALIGRGRGRDGVPSDYVVQIVTSDGSVLGPFGRPLRGPGSAPALSAAVAEARAADGRPFTTSSARGGGQWRAVALPVAVGGQPASVVIALPLDGLASTLQQLRQRLVLIGLVIVGACAGLGWLAVRRAFRPLREVETVATAFGEGDTSRRVAANWPGTEVGRLGASVNAMLDRIETTLAAREASENRMRRFVADASHELRTPLSAVRGFAELYRLGAVEPADVNRTFARIEGESRRMGGLVDDLLLLARLDEQRPMRLEDVDLVVLAADAVHDADTLAQDRTVRLTGLDGDLSPGPGLTTGDDGRLRQIITNLLANAVRHTPGGSPIEVGVGTRGDWAMWQVVDHGPGIADEDAERVFERFYRADSSRARSAGGGSGLGLAIVAALAHAHGGAARVVPTPGGGATFEVALPSRGGPHDVASHVEAGRTDTG